MFTNHAQTRCQQRGIPRNVVETILAYGRRGYHQGAQVYFMDKRARRHARTDMGRPAYVRIADRLDTYLVVSGDGAVITVAKRLGRLKF